MNPVHPFKSSTLSSGPPSLHSPSPSLRHSPLSTGLGPSLPSRPPHSPVNTRTPNPPSPVPHLRSSPTFTPSSLGDKRSLTSAEGALTTAGGDASPRLGGKRYSSSFGHRYGASGGAGSEGSAGSGAKEGDRVAVRHISLSALPS